MSKRTATSDLTRDNWQEEDDECEELGVFKQATAEEMKGRLIKKAKRRGESRQEPFKPVFTNFTAFKTQPTLAPNFSFDLNKKPSLGLTNKLEDKTFNLIKSSLSGVDKTMNRDSKDHNMKLCESDKSFNFSGAKTNTEKLVNNKESKMNESAIENCVPSSKSSSNKLYFGNLKALNKSVLKWIEGHFEKNPYINLTPVFDDYKKYLEDLKRKQNFEGDKLSKSSSITTMNKRVVIENFQDASAKNPFENKTTSEVRPTFGFGSSLGSAETNFGVKSPSPMSFSFAGASKFEPKSDTVNSLPTTNKSQTGDGDPTDEPPIVKVDEVKEEGSVYDKKVKLFYKKDGNYVEKGVAMLFIKPNGDKNQLIIRALTNLGNILLNIILNSSIPSQRLGKNNVLIMCIPNPPLDPKVENNTPVSMLIRVKTSLEADDLLKKIEDYKK